MIYDAKTNSVVNDRQHEHRYLTDNYNTVLSRLRSSANIPAQSSLNYLSEVRLKAEKVDRAEYQPFILHVEQGLMVGYNGYFLDTVNQVRIRSLLFDHSRMERGDIAGDIPSKHTFNLKGRTLSPIAANSISYYHAIAECLTKLIVCADAGLTSFDQIVIHGTEFEREVLRRLGFTGNVVSLLANSYPYLHCESLYVPSVYEPNLSIPHKVTSAINKQFMCEVSGGGRRVLILRRGPRAFVQEMELVAELRRLKFESFYLEDLSLDETLNLFGNAEIVVGVHGAGLSNIIFSRPGTMLVEIAIKSENEQTSLLFSYLSNQVGAQHFMYVARYDEATDQKHVVLDFRDFCCQVEKLL